MQQLNSTTRELNFHVIQQLNCITWELIFNITLVDKAKCGEHKSNLDPTGELTFNVTLKDKAKCVEHKPNLDPMRDLIFAMYRWVLPKEKLLFHQQANDIDLDNYEASKCQRIVQALQVVSLNFNTFDIGKTCALCVNLEYTFNDCPEVTNSILQELYILDDSQHLTHNPPHTTVSVTDIAHFPILFPFVDCPNDKVSTGPADYTSSVLWFCFNEPVYCLLDQDQQNFNLNMTDICGHWDGISTHTNFCMLPTPLPVNVYFHYPSALPPILLPTCSEPTKVVFSPNHGERDNN